jgi:nitrilase
LAAPEISDSLSEEGEETFMPASVVVAAVQAAPIYLSLERSLSRALELISEAAKRRAQLVVFPETWLPGYPAWLDICRDTAVWENAQVKRLYAKLLENSVSVPDRVTETLGEAARRYNMTLIMGIHERVMEGAGRGTLYNTILTFGPTGEMINWHRKLVPTFSERMIWGQGDGRGLRVIETPVGRVGGLVCWEHWMPLVRQALHVSGEDIHVALWPSVKEMYQIASRHYAFEGRCFVVAAGGIMRRSDLPRELELAGNIEGDDSEFILNGGSSIIGPDGLYIAGPSFGSEVIILARINLDRIREESMTLDVTGHFNRPDLFQFQVKSGGANSKSGRIGIIGENGLDLSDRSGAEIFLQQGTEVLAPSGTEATPPFRVITTRPSGFDPDRRE